MTDIGVKVEWLVGSDRALAELGKKSTEQAVLRRTLTNGAKIVQAEWKSLAPRLTGQFAESIVIGGNTKLTRRQKSSIYKAGAHGVVEIHIGSVDVAGLQTEFGNIHQSAEPSGRPAWEASKGTVLTTIGHDLWEEIRKAAERAARKAAKAAAA